MSTVEVFQHPTAFREVAPGTRLTAEQQAVVESNVRLISLVVKPGTPNHDDAWQNGVLGLARAAQKFDPAKGFKFSTYAMWWIRVAVQRGGDLDSVHGPKNIRRGDPLPHVVALDAPLGDGEASFVDLLVADDDPEADALSLAWTADVGAQLRGVCKDDMDHAVVDVLLARSPPSRAELARRLGVTGEAVRQREMRLLARVRHPVYRKTQAMSVVETPSPIISNGHLPEGEQVCGECGHVAKNAAGLSIHKGRSHGAAKVSLKRETSNEKPVTRKPQERPRLDTTTIKASLYDEDDYDPWLVLVGTSDDDGPKVETAIVSTKVDAEQVAALLTALGHQPRRFRLADGS